MRFIGTFILFAGLGFSQVPAQTHWIATWGAAPTPGGETTQFNNQTLREIVHVSLGGDSIRVRLSNAFSAQPVDIGAAHVALHDSGPSIVADSDRAITFSGRPAVQIPPGAVVLSDPVKLTVPPAAELAVSVYIPGAAVAGGLHGSSQETSFLVTGDATASASLTDPKKQVMWAFLTGVDVAAPESAGAIVAFGDSITDGARSTVDANRRWPDFLAARLLARKSGAMFSVVDIGIGGNRVLNDGTGPSALARFDGDVLAQSGVKYLILLESINDIGHAFDPDPAKRHEIVSADDLIQGLTQLAERAHAHGIKVFGATLTPYLGAGYASPEGEAARKAVNQWIRTSNALDGVIDFEAATIDKATGAFDLRYNAPPHPDHLHPNDAGMEAMANAIDLKLFMEK